jgi:hypothetical protein
MANAVVGLGEGEGEASSVGEVLGWGEVDDRFCGAAQAAANSKETTDAAAQPLLTSVCIREFRAYCVGAGRN